MTKKQDAFLLKQLQSYLGITNQAAADLLDLPLREYRKLRSGKEEIQKVYLTVLQCELRIKQLTRDISLAKHDGAVAEARKDIEKATAAFLRARALRSQS